MTTETPGVPRYVKKPQTFVQIIVQNLRIDLLKLSVFLSDRLIVVVQWQV
jgi:hypothetical protein